MIMCDYLRIPVVIGPFIIIPEAFVAYRLSQARKHWRSGAFDDRLSAQEMNDAEAWLIKKWENEKE
jgi:hypothetical protein